MEEYEVIISRLTEMRSRFDSGFSSSDRSYIEQQYRAVLGKAIRRSGCADCYRDAFLETFTYLKRLGTMPTKPNYVLKAGVIVHPNGTNQFYANTNIPDEVAEQRLAEYPESIADFLSYPSDWKERVEARKNGEEAAPSDLEAVQTLYKEAVEKGNKALAELATKNEELEGVKAKLAATEDELAAVKEQLAAQPASTSDDDGSLSMENETLKTDLEAAQAEIAALKQQLEEAKAATATTTKKRASKAAAE